MSEIAERPLRLLDQVAFCCRRRHYSKRTAEAYVYWVRRFVLFHGKRHPRELGEEQVRAFLDHLVAASVSSSTHAQALWIRLRDPSGPGACRWSSPLRRLSEYCGRWMEPPG